MSRAKEASGLILLALNTILTAFVGWTQIIIAQEGQRYGLDEPPPVGFLLFSATIMAACAYALFTRKYGAAIVGGAVLALLLGFACLLILSGMGM